MRACDYVATTGREAPILTANGPVRKSWVIRGEPVYATSGHKDPLLYVMFYLDVFPDPSNPAAMWKVKHLTQVVNGWMQVAAGSAGTAGSMDCNGRACPVGFINDPQVVVYSPKLRDGTTSIIDYDAVFSETVMDPTLPTNTVSIPSNTSPGIGTTGISIASLGNVPGISYGTLVSNATNPGSIPAGCYVTDPSTGSLSCTTAPGTRRNGVQSGDKLQFDTYFAQLNNPTGTPSFADEKNGYFRSSKSGGDHIYYPGSCFKYTTAGTPPKGMTSNSVYYAMPSIHTRATTAGDRFQLVTSPNVSNLGMPSSYVLNPSSSRFRDAVSRLSCVSHPLQKLVHGRHRRKKQVDGLPRRRAIRDDVRSGLGYGRTTLLGNVRCCPTHKP